MDGADGHGTNESVTEYTAAMKHMNIILVRQVPNSPDTNVLDLGIWMSLQLVVEKRNQLSRSDMEDLHDSCVKVCAEVANEEVICRVYVIVL